jgi:hypothetical protein
MTDEAWHEQVLDSLLDMQAKLRGDDITRRLDAVAPKPEKPADPDASGERPLRLTPDSVAVRRGEVEVEANAPPSDADRLAALSERLKRVERELSQAMDRLQLAESRFVRDEDDPEPTSPELQRDRERDVYRRVHELQDLAAHRQPRRRR